MSEAQIPYQSPVHSARAEEEKDFELFLPAVVSGINASGNEFNEKTELTSMSSLKAHFGLKSKVTIGTKLNVVLEIPKTLILENHLRLRVSGDVIYVKADTGNSVKQLISIKLDRTYKIQPIKN